MSDKSYYDQLAESIGAGDSKYVPAIFEILTDENEAKFLLAAAPPATIEEIAEKTGFEKFDVEKMIEPLFKKGLLFKSRKEDATRYYRVRHVMQFHDSSGVMVDPSQKMLDLWKDWTKNEWGDTIKQYESVMPQGACRVIPVNINIEHKSQILAFDDIVKILENARNIAVTPCSCRVVDGACGKSIENCIQVDRAADYAIERGTGRQLTAEEAIKICKDCEEEGLVHVVDNNKSVGHVICNCCSDCCINWPSIRTGLKKFVQPSRFEAVVDADLCSTCESCLDRCYFDAITMEGEGDTALINSEKCLGCGLCMVTCPDDAISLKETRQEDFIPG